MVTQLRKLSALSTILGLALTLQWQAVAFADNDEQPAAITENGAPNAETEGALSEDQVNELIRQLNDDKFAARQAATRKLTEAGAAVIPALAKAAQGGELEVTTRAFNIFEKHLRGDETEAIAAVRKSLQELAASENEATAGRAAKLLEQPALDQPQLGGIQIGPGGGIQIGQGGRIQFGRGGGIQIGQGGRIQIGGGGGQIQIQVQAIGGGNKKFQMKNVNGVKEIEAEEDGRTVKIVDDPNKGIKMEVTETKDNKKETRKYEAKSADELQKNHPDAHKLYKKYTQGNGILPGGAPAFGGGIIQLQKHIQIGPNGIQVLPQQPPEKKAENDGQEGKADKADDKQAGAFEDAKKQLKELSKLIGNQAGDGGVKDLETALEQLEQLQQQLEQLGQPQQ